MIRNRELLSFLETISTTVTHELRPDLRSSNAEKSADFLITVLNRLVAQLRESEGIATARLEPWQRLRAQSPILSGPIDDQPGVPVQTNSERLESELEILQRQLLDERGFSLFTEGLGNQESRQTQWFRQAVAETATLWEAIEESVQPPVPRKTGANAETEPAALQTKLSAYLAAKFPQLPQGAIATFRIASGGSTKLTVLFSLRPNPVLPERLVLRQDLAGNLTGTSVPEEYPIVDRLSKLGLLVPRPILVEPDPEILGGAFMITSEIADAVPAGVYFPKERRHLISVIGPRFVQDAAEELARLHRSTATAGLVGSDALSAHAALVDAAHRRWRLINKPPHSLVIDLGFAWLKAHPLTPDRPRCLVHGDYGLHNMMARDGRLAGVLDWELAQDDDPAIDLAQCRMLMVDDLLAWDEFVATYLAAGGDPRACDPVAVAYYSVWMFIAKFGVMVAEARSYYMMGGRVDSLTASIASHSMDRILQYAALALKRAIG